MKYGVIITKMQFHRMKIASFTLTAIITAFVGGCAVAPAPLPATPHVVATPQNGMVNVAAQPLKPVGDVLPVYVSIANGTEIPRIVAPDQVFALNEGGERIAPIPTGEAARQAGGVGELKAALESGAISGGFGTGIGAGLGAAAGSAFGAVGSGALLGGAIGGAEALFSGVSSGVRSAHRQANQQIASVALKHGKVYRGFTQSGYVFFPKGNYANLEFVLVNQETGDTQDIKTPWR
ncbi:MAG: hypothetical protein IVW54_07615 [Candidatus Binataceae bacterium]|nr:hypothetical protein [Candidatus Binataceae bacterium]